MTEPFSPVTPPSRPFTPDLTQAPQSEPLSALVQAVLPMTAVPARLGGEGPFVPGGLAALPQTLHLEIATVNALLYAAEVHGVNLPGEAGALGVLPGHDPLLTLLRPGKVQIVPARGAVPEVLYVLGGLAEVGPGHVSILADHAVHDAQEDQRRSAEALRRAEQVRERPVPRPQDHAGLKAELDAELLRFFELALFGHDR